MPPAVVPVEDGDGGGSWEERAPCRSCHVAWLAWWEQVRCLVASTFLPCHAALGLSLTAPDAAAVRGTLFLPSTGDRRVRLFLHEHSPPSSGDPAQTMLVLDLLAGLSGADIGRGGEDTRREKQLDAEGWVLEKLWAVTAGAGRLPGGAGVEYLRGRFEKTVASSDAESFHLVDPIGWLGFNGNDGLSIFFHRI
ncbi:hypothetical protein E2562_028221 [Oryza meyeriana var. granulata]|uniref:Uncharacterized protein n=1 Tax=Oryza meyeriana var. granulata TaxID=110450 RepID=A0A6G1DPM3_9ORYZ|nr:hypothetical protein E2562_028221 [Oryza meyeriana var. granulata]